MKQAKEKVWVTKDGKLVKDGHEDAYLLVAAEGQEVPDEYVKGYDNPGSFFKDATAKTQEPIIPAPKPEQFKPGQTNAPASGGPQEKVGPVKTIGEPSVVVGDHAAAVSQKGQSTMTPKPQKGQSVKKTATTTNKKKGR